MNKIKYIIKRILRMHSGVGVIFRNKSSNLFFIQEKDEEYHTVKYRNCFSLWGGGIEKGESETSAIYREVKEEIVLPNYEFLNSIKLKGKYFLGDTDHKFNFTLFESIVDDTLFKQITTANILEGRGRVVSRKELSELKWIWGLEKAITDYLSKFQETN